jgi:protocatechuate 3,4-dioxygenase beta subunit
LLDAHGVPIKNAVIEIWQVDNTGTYLQERDQKSAANFDPNFQGFGRFEMGSNGEHRFRTIKPVPYPTRPAPHIHFMVKMTGHDPWTTQLYVKGHPAINVTAFIVLSETQRRGKRSRWISCRLKTHASANSRPDSTLCTILRP